MIHALKEHCKHFEDLIWGRRTYEVRFADRPYREGDLLALNEYNPDLDTYTGRSCLVQVTNLWDDPKYVREGYVIMSVRPVSIVTADELNPGAYLVPLITEPPEEE